MSFSKEDNTSCNSKLKCPCIFGRLNSSEMFGLVTLFLGIKTAGLGATSFKSLRFVQSNICSN